MDEIFDKYRKYLEAQGKNDKTIESYVFNVNLFFEFLNSEKEIKVDNIQVLDLIIDDDIEDYIIYCKKKPSNRNKEGNKVPTVNLKLTALRQFYKFLNQKNIINNYPLKTIKNKNTPQAKEDFLDVEEAVRIIKAAEDTSYTNCNRERDVLILKIFLYCGLRISELINLKVVDIENKDSLLIKGKRDKERYLALNDDIHESFNKYMQYRKRKNLENEYLFIKSTGDQLKKGAVENLVDKYAKLAGINKNIHPHSLRHGYASMTAQITNAFELMELMGHDDPNTTKRYYHLSKSRSKEIANNNPLLKKAQEV